MEPGPSGAITDVPGVRVGHVTLVAGEGPLAPGRGPVRTGVTAIVPGDDPYAGRLAAGLAVLNGFGKMTGLAQLAELGRLETPIVLTNTLSVWRAAEAVATWVLERHPEVGVTAPTVNPVVGECNDGWLNDIRGLHVRPEHVLRALAVASAGPVAEGSVGAGTGMVAFGWKGGVGTSSRSWDDPLTGRRVRLGCLVVANFGRPGALVFEGVPVGKLLTADRRPEPPVAGGSVVAILATDAPLTSRQLSRLARRAGVGLARTGGVHAHGSGDFALAFSTARAYPPFLDDEGPYLAPFFEATADCVAEAVWRALLRAETTVGRDGHRADRLPADRVLELLRRHGRAERAEAWEAWLVRRPTGRGLSGGGPDDAGKG